MVTVANFSKKQSHYAFPCNGGLYTKILDSADTTWLGPGSALPEKTKFGDNHTICPLSMAVFINQKVKNNG
jgi:hypothetical protein